MIILSFLFSFIRQEEYYDLKDTKEVPRGCKYNDKKAMVNHYTEN
jgi:hypothetical protein